MDDQNLNKLLLHDVEDDDYDCFSCNNYKALYECELCKKLNCGRNSDCYISFPHYNNTELVVCKECYNKVSDKLKPWKEKKSKLVKSKIVEYS